MWDETKQAARGLTNRPGFSLLATGTLALGIGATITIFTVVDATLLSPLPFQDPDELVVLREQDVANGREPEPTSAANLEDWRTQSSTLEAIAGWTYWGYAVPGEHGAEELLAARVSPGLFPLLGVEPIHGRGFRPEEGLLGSHRALLLSYGLWQGRFGGSEDVLGRTMTLDGEPYSVVGVMPAGFRFPDDERVALWTPLAYFPWEERSRAQRMFHVVARRSDGVGLKQVRAEMSAIASRLADSYPDTGRGYEIVVTPAGELVVGDVRPALLVLLGAVGFVLLIACANVAGLLLARGSHRMREVAIRRALGASRAAIVRFLLLESLLLAITGAAVGVVFALVGVEVVTRLDPGHLPGWNPVRLDASVLAFVVTLALLTAIASGLAPAWRMTMAGRGWILHRPAGQVTASPETRRFRHLLIVGETAVAIVLLVGAGLLIRSFHRVTTEDPGFVSENVLAVTLYLPDNRYTEDAQQVAFFEQLLERMRSLPGVLSAGGATTLPMSGAGIDHDMPFGVDGTPSALADPPPQADFRIATEGYFETLGLPLLAGRGLEERDRADAEPVVVVNRSLVDRYLPVGVEPIGRLVRIGTGERWHRIVGVVSDVRHRGLDAAPRPELYVPFRQIYSYGALEIAVRSEGDPSSLVTRIRDEIAALDPQQPVSQVRSVEELVRGSVADRRFNLTLLSVFAGLALVLAAVGIYAAIAFGVAGRRSEIGVRMALGAKRLDVTGWVLREALVLTAVGILLGGAGSLVLTRLLDPLLYETSPRDPWTFAAVPVLFLAIAALASLAPALRAARMDPVEALRAD